jgi:uncharacterized protein YkwD
VLAVLLCALVGVTGWVALPGLSEYATRSQASPPGEIGASASPVQRTGRVTRNQRFKPAPSRSAKPSRTEGLTGDAALEAAVIDLVNTQRRRARCPEVHLDERLRTAARGHSVDMARRNEMSHEGSDGSSPWDRAERAGYDAALSENVAMGYATAQAVMDGWMNSRGHRDNILNCEAKAIGVGLARSGNGTPYWTQMFGRV